MGRSEIKLSVTGWPVSSTHLDVYKRQLYTVGHLENVLDFAYTQADVKDIKMKRDVKAVQLSDEYLSLIHI